MGRRLEQLRERHGERLAQRSPGAAVATGLVERIKAGPNPRGHSRFGAPGRLARRVLLGAARPYATHQRGVDAEIAKSLETLEGGIHNLDMTAAMRHATLLAELRRDTSSSRELWSQIAGLTRSAVALESATAQLQRAVGELPDVPQRLEQLDRSIKHMEWEGRAIPHMEGRPFVTGRHPVAGVVEGYADANGAAGPRGDAQGYRSFEDIFRGSEEFIRERQRPYLEILADRQPVLEFGCGRGEFLDLLRDRGLAYMGVDLDAGMVERCHEKGHTQVAHEDGLEYMEGLADGSLGAVFSAQVIEHLPYEQLLRLLALARAKLADDGVLIAETVNPHSAAALKTFWVDLTHQQPIFPEVALALCRDVGFASAYVFHPGGTGDVEQDRFTEGAFAVVANTTKPVEALRAPVSRDIKA
jgi:SAM-dependent methyltransferase